MIQTKLLPNRFFRLALFSVLLIFVALVVGATLVGMTASFFGLFAAENAHVAGINRSIRLTEIGDGTSNTLLTGEVKHAPRAWGDFLAQQLKCAPVVGI